jgi:hypothetical protein
VFGVKKWMQFADAPDIYDERAMDAQEFARIEAGFQAVHRRVQQVGFRANVNFDVTARRFDPVNFVHIQKQNPPCGVARFDGQARQILFARALVGEQSTQLFIEGGWGCAAQQLARTVERGQEAHAINRFKQ